MDRFLTSCLAATLLLAGTTAAYPSTNQVYSYYSRPDLNPPKWNIPILDKSKVNPGYIFMSPYSPPPFTNSDLSGVGVNISDPAGAEKVLQTLSANFAEAVQNAPYIYTSDGEPVFSGWGSTGGQYFHDPKPIIHNGKQYISVYQGDDVTGGDKGHGMLLDQTYTVVNSYQSGNGRAGNDIHELSVLPGGTTISSIFQPTRTDLRAYNISKPWGWVIQGIFQELDVRTGEVLFEWKSLDHVDPSQSYNIGPDYGSGGNGTNQANAWDYFHINSIEKDTDGNYLVSGRYPCTLYKINGTDGSIIWRLGGMQNDFKLIGFNDSLPFAFQHHARYRSSINKTTNTTILSVFDNGAQSARTFHKYSSALIISLNFTDMSATLLKQFFLPGNTSAISQGNAQVLYKGDYDGTSITPGAANTWADANVFVGFGSEPYLAEYAPDGTCVFKAEYAALGAQAENYRAFKGDWVGKPSSRPAIFTYANRTMSANGTSSMSSSSNSTATSSTVLYVSWNGATEVSTWRFYGGSSTDAGALQMVGKKRKTGFETMFVAEGYEAYMYAEAVDADGMVLGESLVLETYVALGDEVDATIDIGP